MQLSFEITDQLTKQLKHIDHKAARQAALLDGIDRDVRAAMRRQARISTIGASTRIENAVLTDAEIDWIDTSLASDGRPTAFMARRAQIEDKLAKDHERSLEEVAGCREMLEIIYSQGVELFPLTQATLRGMHQQLLQYHAPAAYHLGRYKIVPNSVIERDAATGAERIVLKTSDPGPLTEITMGELLDWYNETLQKHPWPVGVASELVFRFLACHPFQDGNGRIGRALFMLTLLQCPEPHWNQVAPFMAVDRFIEQRKIEYYTVLARTSGGSFNPDPRMYDLSLFVTFMVKVVDEALDAITFYKERVEAIRDLPPSAEKVLGCFKDRPEQRLTARMIRQETNLPGRTVSHSLRRLLDAQLVQRYGRGPGTRYQLVF